MLLNGDEVGKGLQGVHRSGLHSKDGTSAVLHELVDDGLGVVIFAVCQACEGTYSDEVAEAAHHGDSLQQVLALVAIHHHAALGLKFPGAGIHVEHDDIHAKIHRSLLGREAGAK